MAQRTIVTLVDDITGEKAVETVHFALDGDSYTIDLNDKNAAKLRKALKPYITAGHKVSNGAKRKVRVPNASPAEIRKWARDTGRAVSDRGVISDEIKRAYASAHRLRSVG